jgi:hypothetical protein
LSNSVTIASRLIDLGYASLILPIRFQEVTPVRKPGKKATTQQKAAYREAKKDP